MLQFTLYLTQLSRRGKITLQVMLDALLTAGCFAVAVLIRLESVELLGRSAVWASLLATIAVTLIVFRLVGLYRALVRYITGQILTAVAIGVIISAVTLYAFGLIFDAGLPRSVPVIFALLLFIVIGGIRFTARSLFRSRDTSKKIPVIIYGAGESGRQLLNVLSRGREYKAVALVDDDPHLQNMTVGGLHVAQPALLQSLLTKTGANIILLAMPSIGRSRRREVVAKLEDLQVQIKTIPGMSDIISGRAKISELRNISAEDLLGRDPVAPDPALIAKNIAGCVVMVSGAGGSIGGELCRQILMMKPRALILYELSEFSLYTIESELAETAKRLNISTKIMPVLGSVQNRKRLDVLIKSMQVETIYHAAAYKHVPLVEENVVEGVRNNIFGTLAIAAAARKYDVKNFILISTDKAVRPTNIMGATKRIAELICQAYAQESSSTVFSMVRFGNVLGSSGSVIPRFRAQIEQGGPLTVTHRDINRYFMTIPEAAQLVIQAGALGQGGDVFVLDMGEPVKILDLAMTMVRLHGLTPYLIDHPEQTRSGEGDIPICVTGLRKGEKLYEELLIGNNPSPTQHPRIMTASEISLSLGKLMTLLDRLQIACDTFDVPAIIAIIHQMPVSYAPSSTEIFDLQWVVQEQEEKPKRRVDLPPGSYLKSI